MNARSQSVFLIFAVDIKFELVSKKFTFGPSYKDYCFTHGAKNLVQHVNTSVKQLFLSSTMKKRARAYFWCVIRDVFFSSCSVFKFLRHRSQLFEVISVTSLKLNVDLKIPCLPHILKNVIFPWQFPPFDSRYLQYIFE